MSKAMERSFAIAFALLFALFGATTAHAQAPLPVKGEVFVVLASEEAGTIDAELAKMPALRNPPFKSFTSMKILSREAIALVEAKPVTVKLPNGRELRIELLERMPDGRHKVQVSINQPSKKDYLPLLQVKASDEPFFVAGQKHAGGTLVIGVQVGAQAKSEK